MAGLKGENELLDLNSEKGPKEEEKDPLAWKDHMGKEDSLLKSFETDLLDSSKSLFPKEITKRKTLLEKLGEKIIAPSRGEALEENEFFAGELIEELIAETFALECRDPASNSEVDPLKGPLDVQSALEDIEIQVRELERQNGILDAETISLFKRVSMALDRFENAKTENRILSHQWIY